MLFYYTMLDCEQWSCRWWLEVWELLCFCPCRWCTPHRLGSVSARPPSCSANDSAASSPPTHTCSTRSTCRPPSLCPMERNRLLTRAPAPCSCETPSSSWSWTVSRCERHPTVPCSTANWLTLRALPAATRASAPPTPAPMAAWRALHLHTVKSWVTTQGRRFSSTSTAITSPPASVAFRLLRPPAGQARAAHKAQ